MKLTTGVMCLGLVFATAPASAQTEDFSGMNVNGTPRVIVTDRSGQETRGRLVSWTASSIVLDTNGTKRTFASGEAVRVDLRGDSLKNGIIIGAAFGSLNGLLAECKGGAGDCGGERVGVTLVSMALFGAIGAGIDALIPGRSPLWRSGAPAKSARGLTFDVSPRERRASIGWRFQP